jgi:copper homeostasis protein
VHVLLRPRAGNFFYSDEEFELMRDDLLHARALGASGFALGILRADATVDIERTRKLVELASPLEVTFHRAFDLVPSLHDGLDDVIATGCHRILTSGGERDVVMGAANLATLVDLAKDRIKIVAGGGLRVGNAALVARTSKAAHFHGSVRHATKRTSAPESLGILVSLTADRYPVDPAQIQAMIRELTVF